MNSSSSVNTIDWIDPATVRIIDQTRLPYDFITINISNHKDLEVAIKDMLIRGAPAIGIAGAFAFVLGALESLKNPSQEEFFKQIHLIASEIKSTRPTAVNLAWGVDRLLQLAENSKHLDPSQIVELLKAEAKSMHKEDLEACYSIGKFGATLVPKGARILTHCNAGGLATVGYGTALGVIKSAHSLDPSIKVYADETRPRQQGARLTTWELLQDNIDTTLVTDGMCAHLMSKGLIDLIVVGADRIAVNGDTANKIGTFTLALVAKEFKVPFYIAAPLSTIDPNIPDGSHIPIEEREPDEVKTINGKLVCPEDVNVYNPGFDVTPAKYIAAIITDKGILRPDYTQSIRSIFN